MVRMACDYHKNLQHDGITLSDDHPEYKTKIKLTLQEIPQSQKLSEEAKKL